MPRRHRSCRTSSEPCVYSTGVKAQPVETLAAVEALDLICHVNVRRFGLAVCIVRDVIVGHQ